MSVACRALGLNRSSLYRRRRRAQGGIPLNRARKASVQPRALSRQEREWVIETLHSEPYRDQPPAEVYQRLLEQGTHLCSISTMHRVLREQKENGERRHQRPAQHFAIPRLLAFGSNEVWSWDSVP